MRTLTLVPQGARSDLAELKRQTVHINDPRVMQSLRTNYAPTLLGD
jgi:hypothetical protein